MTAQHRAGAKLTVLLYHRVLAEPDALLPHDLDAAKFDTHLASLSQVFKVLPLEEALTRLRAGTLPSRAVSITFDDGYRDNIEVAVPILKKHGMTATFFVSTGFLDGGRMMHDTVIESVRRLSSRNYDLTWAGLGNRSIDGIESRISLIDEFVRCVKYLPFHDRLRTCEQLAFEAQGELPSNLMMTSEQVRQLAGTGMDVGAHTHDHTILSRLNTEEAWSQISKSREILKQLLGPAPPLFAYPNGKPNIDYRSDHVELVKRAGFSGAASVSVGTASRTSDHFQVPRFVPWDRNPKHLVLRVLAHRWRYTTSPVATQ